MKIITFLMLISLNLILTANIFSQKHIGRKKLIIIEAAVEKMQPPVPPGGLVANYRLAKYKVISVCKGKYTGEEIVVDHYVSYGDEFEGLEAGSRVYLAVTENGNVSPVYTYKGIRDTNVNVGKLYLGNKVYLAERPGCSYRESDLLIRKAPSKEYKQYLVKVKRPQQLILFYTDDTGYVR